MKASILLFVVAVALSTSAQNPPAGRNPGGSQAPGLTYKTPGKSPIEVTPYAVTERGPHHRVWQQVTAQTNQLGKTIYRTNSFTELATGMHHWNGQEWVESTDRIHITDNGASATNTQHQVNFSANINTAGAIDLTMPDGRHLRSHVVGLAYFDESTGKSVMIAETKDSIGQLLPGLNQVLYTNAFTDFQADVRYTHRKRGFEQDVILRTQPPSPTEYGLNPETTRLQIWTEFLNPPEPEISPKVISVPIQGRTALAKQTLRDQNLKFGGMHIGQGKAFSLDGSTNELATVPVAKEWVHTQGRTFLVEQVLLNSVAKSVKALAPTPSSGTHQPGGVGKPGASLKLKVPAIKQQAGVNSSMTVVRVDQPPSPGLVLDYDLSGGSLTDFTFQSDTTYYVSDEVDLYGTNTIEGGTVIKCGDAGNSVAVYDTLVCQTAPYRPAIFTCTNDDSVGAVIPGSSGMPTDVAITTALYCPNGVGAVSNLFFRYMWQGFVSDVGSMEVWDCQFMKCSHPIACNPSVTNIALHNVLITMDDSINSSINFCGCPPGALTIYSQAINIYGENITADLGSQYFHVYFVGVGDPDLTIVSLTNSIIITPYLDAYYAWGSPVGITNVTTNSTFYAGSLPGDLFQTVGTATHYLADNSPYRNFGNTNISPDLLINLKQKTTYPPIVYSATNISNNLVLSPVVFRDTGPSPDLGYHYSPIDYAFGDVLLTNATITVNSGTVIAAFTGNGSSAGLTTGTGSQFFCQGTPINPNHIVAYNTVQEQSTADWSTPVNSLLRPNTSANSPASAINCRFTDFSILAQDTAYLYDIAGNTQSINFQDCQFQGGAFYSTNATINLTNCLLERVNAILWANDGNAPKIRNNLFWGGSLDVKFMPTNSLIQDNFFDKTAITDHGITSYVGTFNGYLVNSNHLTLTNAHDVFLGASPIYQNGALGTYYQPTNDSLFHIGNTNASLIGLYHYTTQTNQTKEGTNRVTIGYHYVALGTNGTPFDDNGNGISDYLENPNGSAPPFILTQPNSQMAGIGTSVTFSVVALGDAPLSYQWTFNGTNITGATSTTFTTNNVQTNSSGSYEVTVSNNGGGTASSNAVLTVLSPTTNGMVLWLRADAGVTTNGSGLVSVWADQTGIGNNAVQGSTGVKPQWVGNVVNGLPVVRFTGDNDDGFDLPGSLYSGATQAEAYVVLKANSASPSGNRGIWQIGSSSGDPLYPDTTGRISEQFGSSIVYSTGAPSQPLTQFHLYNVVSTSSEWTSRVNGKVHFTTSVNTVGFTGFPQLGRMRFGFDGDMAEVLMYNRALTSTERDSVATYLNAKYAFVSISPATPTNLHANAVSPGQVSLFWNSALTNSKISFVVERKTGVGGTYAQVALVDDAASYIDSGLTGNTQYYYRIKAHNYASDSGYSNETNATTLVSGSDIPLSDMKLWLKADSGHGSTMIHWVDQSENRNDASQLVVANQPQVAYSSINGLPTIAFDGSSSQMSFPGGFSTLSAAEAFVVLKVNTSVNGLWVFGASGFATGPNYPDSLSIIRDDFGSSTRMDEGTPAQSLTQYHVYNVLTSPGEWSSRINGTSLYRNTGNYVQFNTSPNLGFSHNYLNGNIAEFFIFDRGLSLDERNAVGSYLNQKYLLVTNTPTAPTNTQAIALSPTQMSLVSTGNLSNVVWIKLERKEGSGGTYSQVGASAGPSFTFVDTLPSTTAQYYYRATSYDYATNSSSVVIAPPVAAITNPVSVVPISTGTNVTIYSAASDPDGSISNVALYNGSVLLATATSPPYNFTISTTNGVYLALTTKATDNQGNTRISAQINLPLYLNSSGDGRNDGWDILLGLDPTNTNNIPFNPSDTTSPVIHLLQPTNATPLP